MALAKWRREIGILRCGCGCGEDCKTPGSKFAHGHAARAKPLADRFWKKVERTEDCWLWRGCRFHSGYGQIDLSGKKARAHRVAYELTYGPIPKGQVVRHTCDNPPCVNPEHLVLGTQAENSLDMVTRGRGANLLFPDEVLAIREAYATKSATQTALGRQYGVSASQIHKIVHRKSWAHLH